MENNQLKNIDDELIADIGAIQVGLTALRATEAKLAAIIRVEAPVPVRPSTPVGMVALVGDRQVSLRWQPVDGAIVYNVWEVHADTVLAIPGTVPFLIVTGLDNDSSYSFAVSAVGLGGESDRSESIVVVPSAPIVVVPPDPGPDPVPVPPDQLLPLLEIIGTVPNVDSCLILYRLFPGSLDTRAYEKTHDVKAAAGNFEDMLLKMPTASWGTDGLKWLPNEPRGYGVIEYNGIEPGTTPTVTVEAVNMLCPHQDRMGMPDSEECTTPGCNGCLTPGCDDTMYTNGAGNPDNFPIPIARATVQLSTQARDFTGDDSFFDTFAQAEEYVEIQNDPREEFSSGGLDFQYQSRNWTVGFYHTDRKSECVVMDHKRHNESRLADGGMSHNQDGSEAGGQGYSSEIYKPRKQMVLPVGKVAHATFEVNAHWPPRVWGSFYAWPKSVPLIHTNHWELALNPFGDKKGFVWNIGADAHMVRQFDPSGPPGQDNGTGFIVGEKLLAQYPKAFTGDDGRVYEYYDQWGGTFWRCTPERASPGQEGHADWANAGTSDRRHRFDMLWDRTHFICLEEGTVKLTGIWDLSLDWEEYDIGFVGHVYHSQLMRYQLKAECVEADKFAVSRDWEKFVFKFHWDNMGWRVMSHLPSIANLMPLLTQSFPAISP